MGFGSQASAKLIFVPIVSMLVLPDLEIAVTQHNFEVNYQCGRWIARITTVPFSVGRREGSARCVSSREVSREPTHIAAVGDGHELHDRDSYYRTVVKAEEVRERGFVHGGHFKLEAPVVQS